MEITFLGTGTSHGIPVIGCSCRACVSTDPRDKRFRHGALLQSDDASHTLLIDTPPELRLQLLAANVSRLDAVWFTHGHADHTHGIDDLRVFSHGASQRLPAYADELHAAALRTKFGYIFDEDYQPIGGPKVELGLLCFRAFEPVQIGPFEMLPLAFPHGDVGLVRALERLTGERPSFAELSARAERWRPWRAYAALHLWAADAALTPPKTIKERKHAKQAA